MSSWREVPRRTPVPNLRPVRRGAYRGRCLLTVTILERRGDGLTLLQRCSEAALPPVTRSCSRPNRRALLAVVGVGDKGELASGFNGAGLRGHAEPRRYQRDESDERVA